MATKVLSLNSEGGQEEINIEKAYAKMSAIAHSVDVNDSVKFYEENVKGMSTTGYGINVLSGVTYKVKSYVGIVNAQTGTNMRIRYRLHDGTSYLMATGGTSQTIAAGSAAPNQSNSPGIYLLYTPGSNLTLTVRIILDEIGTGTIGSSSYWGTIFTVEEV